MEGKASLVKERWTPQAAGGIPTGFAAAAVDGEGCRPPLPRPPYRRRLESLRLAVLGTSL